MKRRRTRLFRDEVLAPWLTLGVIIGLWWLGAHLLSWDTPVTADAPLAADSRVRPDSAVPGTGGAVNSGAAAAARIGSAPASPDRGMPPPADVAAPPASISEHDVGELLARRLLVPVSGIQLSSLYSTFEQARGAGRVHEAIDILAPRGTPVVAALEGRVVKLFTSAAGGLTIYQFDREEEYCYYYAHLDGYAPNLTEGNIVKRGDTIGFVGTTGNAPSDTPHLHFAIFKLGADKRWWEGTPVDPFLVLR